MWKFGNFPLTHILREIDFCKHGVSKLAILTVSSPLNFGFGELLQFSELKFLINQNSASKIVEIEDFETLKLQKMLSRKI